MRDAAWRCAMNRPDFRLVAWTLQYLRLLEALGKSSVAIPVAGDPKKPARKP